MMLVIPAIDIKEGRCVRLVQGRFETETVYFENPVQTAQLWRVQNAKTLHVVDLDGALRGEPVNLSVVEAIAQTLDIPIQVGGGVRTYAHARQLLDMGVYRVVLGTAAVRDPELIGRLVQDFGSSRVVVSLDARDGEIRTQGWRHGSKRQLIETALEVKALGVNRVIFTDIARDGMLSGPNLEALRQLAEATGLRITASGGVSSYRDLLALADLEPLGVDSVIIGRALYEGHFPCQKLWCVHYKEELDLSCFTTARIRRQR
ncbi:MAG: 1-(5-phosphoribosyl)-5-[(5-phosphoribosylamino)methylideneamino]imidazole-4-carboxamide isomerase [Bacteroidetes bacterium]|nr:1-(5-phosphoribosyl)-5-[(5-phosphoribosylamino)methylideneamino]imidazole-4-carboxamide isomerase [Bacteroidota bacterium]